MISQKTKAYIKQLIVNTVEAHLYDTFGCNHIIRVYDVIADETQFVVSSVCNKTEHTTTIPFDELEVTRQRITRETINSNQ